MSDINTIASMHLGKTSDGATMTPYITPDAIDPNLLVPIPRKLNRTAYDITDNHPGFVGFDTWNCYEVSFLTDNGYPINCVLKFIIPSGSDNIVESKSLKLYLNSFNMVKLGPDIEMAMLNAQYYIEGHLCKVLGVKYVPIKLFSDDIYFNENLAIQGFMSIEKLIDVTNVKFDQFTEDANILENIPTSNHFPLQVRTNTLRSNCRVTNQPDWGDVYIHIRGDQVPTLDSLLKYIVSLRKENHFHEEICEMIYKRLFDKFLPSELLVACMYTRRGGIDINPVRASNSNLLDKYVGNLENNNSATTKTMRQ